jgi:NAD(P)-dependent dehydrogenase (short-subunit alcohol dehydrogenase family)
MEMEMKRKMHIAIDKEDKMGDKKVCVITGATGGIGKEVVKKYYKNDYDVVMLDIREETLSAFVEAEGMDEARVSYYTVDVSSEQSVIDTINKIKADKGRIDVLVNTAGIIGKYGETIDYEFENFKRIYEINVFGTFLMMKYTLPIMVEQGKGAIVNFGSCSGMTGYTLEIGYGSSKWAVIGMTKNVANEYASRGIRANSISPGWVNTAMLQQSIEDYAKTGQSPNFGCIGRPGEPSEMADAVYYLSSDEASFVNGTNLLVDGGKMLD